MSETNLSPDMETGTFHFLLEDYKQAKNLYNRLNQQINSTIIQAYIYFAFMLLFLVFLLKYDSISGSTLIAFSISICGIIISLRTIRVFLNIQNEKSHLDSRIEYIRGLFLIREKPNSKVSQYLLSHQKIALPSEESTGRNIDNRKETYYNVLVMLGFLSSWITTAIFVICMSWSGKNLWSFSFSERIFPPALIIIFFLVKKVFFRLYKQEISLPGISTKQ
jgi:hypothetical protein